MADDEFVWLEYPANGNKAQFPVQAAAVWRARGWVDTDPDPDPSIWRDSPEAIAEAEAVSAARRPKPPVAADADVKPMVLNPGADASNGNADGPTGQTSDARTAGRKSAAKSTEES